MNKKDKVEKVVDEPRSSLGPSVALFQTLQDKSCSRDDKQITKVLDRTSYGLISKRHSIVNKVSEQELKQKLLQKKREINEKYSNSPAKNSKLGGALSRQSRTSSNLSSSHSRSENKSFSKDNLAST